jgi:head-tail adaptor
MTAGPMRFRFDLMRKAAGVRDTYGHARGTADQYTNLGTQWGSLRQIGAREAVNADRLKVVATHTVTLRYVRDIDPATDRLVGVAPSAVAGKVYSIEVANDVDGRHREYQLMVQEVRNPAQ